MLVRTDRGDVATDGHLGTLGGEILVLGGRLVEVTGALAGELRAELGCHSRGVLRDIEQGGPAALPSLRAAVVLRWVRDSAVVEGLDGDPGVAVPVPPIEPGVIY